MSVPRRHVTLTNVVYIVFKDQILRKLVAKFVSHVFLCRSFYLSHCRSFDVSCFLFRVEQLNGPQRNYTLVLQPRKICIRYAKFLRQQLSFHIYRLKINILAKKFWKNRVGALLHNNTTQVKTSNPPPLNAYRKIRSFVNMTLVSNIPARELSSNRLNP